jgi:hypothetical protein
MDIVRITMEGYGCEIARAIIPKEEYKKLKNSNTLDNVWLKNLYKKKVKKEFKNIEEQFHNIGLINGDLEISVDGEIILELPINVTDTHDLSKLETLKYPKTNEIVLTTVQHQEGIVCDTMFITKDDFDIEKLKIIEKQIEGRVDNVLIPSLYCEIRYDGETVPISGTITDLRTSRLFYDTHEKNKNR